VEAHAEDFCEEVDGISREVVIGPSPIGVFDDETGEGAEVEVIGFALGEGEAASVQHGRERDEAGGADLFAGPAGLFLLESDVMVFSPMRLNEDAVDLFEINGAGLIADGFDEGADGEVSVDSLAPARLALRAACGSLPRGSPASGGACAAEDSVAGAHDEGESFRGKRVVANGQA